jgi:electron transfer flavoprotein beta subunit
VVLGKQAIDGDNNQVAQLTAEYLGWPQATFAYKVELIDGNKGARVQREVDGGVETVEVSLPAVLTTDLRLNEPRYASLPGIMKAKKKPLDEVTPADLGVDTALKVETVGFEPPPGRKAGVKVKTVDELIEVLQGGGFAESGTTKMSGRRSIREKIAKLDVDLPSIFGGGAKRP